MPFLPFTPTRYHLVVLVVYLTGIPILLSLYPVNLAFAPKVQSFPLTLSLVTAPILILFLYLRRTGNIFTPLGYRPFIAVFVYGLLFAIPEEILFRGVLQTMLGSYFGYLPVAVLVSSLLFGVAHTMNGATGIHPRLWNWKLVGLTTLGGIPLGTLFAVTGSLFYPILLHTIFILALSLFRKP